MLSSKERSKLMSIASGEDAVFQVGKAGITDVLIKELSDALNARELIKINVLPAAGTGAKEVMERLCAALGAEPVRAIGRKVILYKRPKDPSKAKIALS